MCLGRPIRSPGGLDKRERHEGQAVHEDPENQPAKHWGALDGEAVPNHNAKPSGARAKIRNETGKRTRPMNLSEMKNRRDGT